MSLVQNNTVTFLKRPQNKPTVCMMPSRQVKRQCSINERKLLVDVLNQIVTSKKSGKACLGEVEERRGDDQDKEWIQLPHWGQSMKSPFSVTGQIWEQKSY